MKIKNIQLKESENYLILTAECTLRHFGSDVIYFKFDKKYKDFIVSDASPFAAALLIPAMKLGQDITIDGEISEQLYQGLQEVMKIMLSWNIKLKPISISVKTLRKDTYKGTKNASFFSGGVDSFYTYLKNKERAKEKITHFILANGYDIGLGNKKLWDMTCKTVEDVAKEENIEIIKVESNIRSLIEPIIMWDYTHGGCLAALGLSLRKGLKNIFIASTYSNEELFYWGSHPKLDHLWSTETLSFHHDGADVTRVEKVKFISQYPLVLKNLRVCYLNKKDKFNCGSCDKCIRTMINLHIAGVLEKSETFPHIIDIERIKKLKIEGEHGAIFHKENLVELKKLNIDPQLQNALKDAIRNVSSSQSYVMEAAKKLWFLDYYYNRGRLYILADFFRKRLA